MTISADLIVREFPIIRSELIYLNHAAVAPWPQRTATAVASFADECARHGARDYPRWLDVEQRLKTGLARLLNAPAAEDVALLKSTSEALSVVAHGFPWKSGSNVVISDEEFPSNRIVWESLGRFGVGVRRVPLHAVPDPEAALLGACDAATQLLSVSAVQYASGLRLDLVRLGEMCRQRGIAFCVDAIQGLGAVQHDVQAMHIDFLMADGHKWLLAPEGVTVFYCAAPWRERLTLHQYGWHMVEDVGNYDRRDWQVARGARRFECGSPNMLGIRALAASLSLIEEIGIASIEQQLLERSHYLLARIAARPDLELLSDARPTRYAGIVSFRGRARPINELWQRLLRRGVVCAQRGSGIRFSPHFYTPEEQLAEALQVL